VKKTTPQTSALIYPDSRLYIKEMKASLSRFATLTKGDLLGLDHTCRVCKGHLMHITTPTKPELYLLGDPLLILPSLHPLLGPMHLSIIPSQPISHSNLMFCHNLNGLPYSRGGDPHTKMLPLYFLHHLPTHNSYTLIHPRNPRCLPSKTRTQIIGRINKYTVERHHTQLIL